MQVSRDPFTVAGNQCEKGEKFAYQELENPMRVLTTIIKIQGEQEHVVAVRTDRSIEKKDMLLVMKAAKRFVYRQELHWDSWWQKTLQEQARI